MFLHMSLMSLKEDMLCEGTIKKERPGIFFFQKKTTRQVTFFFIFYQIGLNIKKQLL
jgi:hypothetical protein